MRLLLSLAAAMLLSACDDIGAAERMSLADARAALLRTAGSGSVQAFCSEEGRREFRHAVRNFSAAVEADEAPIQPPGVMMAGGDEAWMLVSMGLMARVVQPSDLKGPLGQMAMLMNVPGLSMPGVSETRDAMAHACPELIGVYRASVQMARVHAEYAEAQRDHVHGHRLESLQEDVRTQHERVEAATRRLELKMRNNGWRPENLGPGARVVGPTH